MSLSKSFLKHVLSSHVKVRNEVLDTVHIQNKEKRMTGYVISWRLDLQNFLFIISQFICATSWNEALLIFQKWNIVLAFDSKTILS